MAIKLILTWDIQPGKEQGYFEFITKTFLPAVIEMGIKMNDAWVTVYGDQPQILVTANMSSYQEARSILSSELWQQMNEKLLEFVENYSQKIVPEKGVFQF